MARRGRGKKDVAIFTYSELHSPANDSYFYDQNRPDDRYVCTADVREVRPAWARTEDGSFLKIVNTDAFPQKIRMEVCRNAGEPCSFLPRGVTSSCRQRYSVHKMTAEDPDGSSDDTFLAAFKVPSGCFCHIRQQGTHKLLSDLPDSTKTSENHDNENGNPATTPTFQKSVNEQTKPHTGLLGPLNFDTQLNSQGQVHHPFPNEQPTLLTSSFQQSTVTTTLRPIITMTTSIFGNKASQGLNTISPSTTLSPPQFVTHHFHQPGEFQTLGPITTPPELQRPVRQNKEKISVYSQQLLDALLYNFNRGESLEGFPTLENDEDEVAFLKELESLPDGLEITRAGNNTFNLSLRRVMRDGKVKPMNVAVSVHNGLVTFIPNSDTGVSQYATTTITVDELYEVLKKYLGVLQQRKPNQSELSEGDEKISDLKTSNTPTIHNHGSPIFIFASQTGSGLQTVDERPPEIIPLPLPLKTDLNKERNKINLVRKSTSSPHNGFSATSVNNDKIETQRKLIKLINLLRNDKSAASSTNRFFGSHSQQQHVQPASQVYSSLLQSPLLNDVLNKTGLPKESAVLHNLTSLINKQLYSKDLDNSALFNATKKAHHIIPVPVFLSVSNHSTNSATQPQNNQNSFVTPPDTPKNSTHVTFHLIPESIPNKSDKSTNSVGSKAGNELHFLLQTTPNLPGDLNSTKVSHHLSRGGEKNGERSALLPVEVTFHQNFSNFDTNNKQIVRIVQQVSPGNGTNGNRHVGPLLSTQLFASRPQVIQNYYIRVPESYLRARNGVPLNLTARSDDGEMLMEIRTHRTIIPPKTINKRSEKHNNTYREESDDNLMGNARKQLNISQMTKNKVLDRQRASATTGDISHAANTRNRLRNTAQSQNSRQDRTEPHQSNKRNDSGPVNKVRASKNHYPDWIKGLERPVPQLEELEGETFSIGDPYRFTLLKVPRSGRKVDQEDTFADEQFSKRSGYPTTPGLNLNTSLIPSGADTYSATEKINEKYTEKDVNSTRLL